MVEPAYSIGTLVTKPAQYAEMRKSFDEHGFTSADCEYLTIDNFGSNAGPRQTDAYVGLNQLLNRARAPYVILCHQDVLLLEDDRTTLDRRLAELTAHDPHWAVAANAGGASPRLIVRHISDIHGPDQRIGELPHRVMSVDENFIVIRREARVGFSHDLSGFHLYGADLCLNADMAGYTAYVIDFHLRHLGASTMGPTFDACERAFRAKWNHALRDRGMQTTCVYMQLTGQHWLRPMTPIRERIALQLGRWRISLKKRL